MEMELQNTLFYNAVVKELTIAQHNIPRNASLFSGLAKRVDGRGAGLFIHVARLLKTAVNTGV